MTNCIGNKCVISVNDSTEWLAIFAFFILSVSLISNVGSPMSKVYSLLYDNSTRRTTSWIINRHWFRIGWIIYCSVLSISGFNVWRTTTNGVDILTTTTTTTITKTTLKIYLVILIIHFCSGWLLQELDSLPWLLLAMNLLLFFSNCVNSTGLWRADISAGLLSILCLIWNSFSIVVILTLSIGVKKAPSKLQSGSLWSRSSPLKANAIAIEPEVVATLKKPKPKPPTFAGTHSSRKWRVVNLSAVNRGGDDEDIMKNRKGGDDEEVMYYFSQVTNQLRRNSTRTTTETDDGHSS